ncbi:MAG TPA: hypothetical protein VGN39_12330, partial [Terriglobales bacterium]|nr:hypothetical protein [Terriglobales bacterium]
NKNNTVDVRPVTVAFTQQNLANIATGLSPGDVVVTDGQDKLQAGSKIQPREQNASGSGTQNAQAGTDQTGTDQTGADAPVADQSPRVQHPPPAVAKPHSGSHRQGNGSSDPNSGGANSGDSSK